jgi:hypothetical protein
VPSLEVLQQHRGQLKFFQNDNKCRISLQNHRQKLQAIQRHRLLVCYDQSVICKELLKDQLIQKLGCLGVLLRLVDLFLTHELGHVVSEHFQS